MHIIYALLITMNLNILCSDSVITPYKFSEAEVAQMKKHGLSSIKASQYQIPHSCRFTTPRSIKPTSDIVFYLSRPKNDAYPIAILCGGSTNKQTLGSIIHFHRHFLQECMDVGIGVITIEGYGIDGSAIDEQIFMSNYTRSQRLQDHITVIEHIKKNSPAGWNGKLVFIGVSEGGPLVTSLTTHYNGDTLATINWCGAGDYSWRRELWIFIEHIKKSMPWFVRWPIQVRMMLPDKLPFYTDFPRNQDAYNHQMDKALLNPSCDAYFLGMTYRYHADAMLYPQPAYEKIQTPFLVVAGVQDCIIESSDAFVQKAREAGVNISYIRVPDMDHYIRTRPDIIAQSFEWLEKQLHLH